MIQEIRFRTMLTPTGQVLVLQVFLYEDKNGYTTANPSWRDAGVEDLLLVANLINPPQTMRIA